MATRRDVAQAASVSVRTVSNVVNGYELVAPDTRKRVLEAIDQLGYQPSEIARTLKVGRSGLVGLMLPELDNPYFAELTRAFVEEGRRIDVTVVVDQASGDIDHERAFVTRGARGGLFDALILSPIRLSSEDVEPLKHRNNTVFLAEYPFPGFDKVMIDNHLAAQQAVEHLLTLGRHRIAAAGYLEYDHGSSQQRLAGYTSALTNAGFPIDPDLVPSMARYSRADGVITVRTLMALPNPPDAVFCFSDTVASGVLRGAHDLGLRVPQDLAVIGFDDIEDGQYSTPTLSSVSPDKNWIARVALERALARFEGDTTPPETYLAPFTLELRESAPATLP